MIKELLEKDRKFTWAHKESFTNEEVASLLDNQMNYILRHNNTIIDEIKKITSEKDVLTTEIEALKETTKNDKTQFEELEKQNETLLNELKPFKKAKIQETSKELLGGLVATGAEYDVFKKLELGQFDFGETETNDGKREMITEKLNDLLEQKPYLKPVVETIENDDKNIIRNKTHEQENNIIETTHIVSGGVIA